MKKKREAYPHKAKAYLREAVNRVVLGVESGAGNGTPVALAKDVALKG